MTLTTPFATADDLADRWRPLSDAEEARATVLLDDASQLILDEDKFGRLTDLTEPTPTLVRIVCAMVRRSMGAPAADGGAVTQLQQAAGPFSTAVTYQNPAGDLYLTTAERRALRFNRQRAGSVDMWDTTDYTGTLNDDDDEGV
jgi:hypothetical protein